MIQQTVEDQAGVTDDDFDVADLVRNGMDMAEAPFDSDRVLYQAALAHDLEEGVVEEFFRISFDQFVKVPKLVGTEEGSVVGGFGEIGVIDLEEIGDVAVMDQAIQGFAL